MDSLYIFAIIPIVVLSFSSTGKHVLSGLLSTYLAHVWWSVFVGICPKTCGCQAAFILYTRCNRVLLFKLSGSWWISSSAIAVNFICAIMIQNKGRGNGWKTQGRRGGRRTELQFWISSDWGKWEQQEKAEFDHNLNVLSFVMLCLNVLHIQTMDFLRTGIKYLKCLSALLLHLLHIFNSLFIWNSHS